MRASHTPISVLRCARRSPLDVSVLLTKSLGKEQFLNSQPRNLVERIQRPTSIVHKTVSCAKETTYFRIGVILQPCLLRNKTNMRSFLLLSILLFSVGSSLLVAGDASFHGKKLDIRKLVGAKKRILKEQKSTAPKSGSKKTKSPKPGSKTKSPKKSGKKSGKKSKSPKTSSAPSALIVIPDSCTLDEDCLSLDFYCTGQETCCEYNTTCPESDGARGAPTGAGSTFSLLGLTTAVAGLIVALVLKA